MCVIQCANGSLTGNYYNFAGHSRQADVDIREEKQKIWHELEEIKHVHA